MNSILDAWDVLVVFCIPIGGGIPAGVLLAKSRGLSWPFMAALYFISDVMLAIVFEPLMHLFIRGGRRIAFLARLGEAFKLTMQKTTSHLGSKAGPLALVMLAFTVDPMTGRAATVTAGHGFITGWLIAIAGDMMYFTVLMVSTLWLNNILGNGTWTVVIILVLMVGVPALMKRLRFRL